jgi:hypothetical protein
MLRTRPGAPVSKIKKPVVVSALAWMRMRLPARVKGMIQEAESAEMMGSTVMAGPIGVVVARASVPTILMFRMANMVIKR